MGQRLAEQAHPGMTPLYCSHKGNQTRSKSECSVPQKEFGPFVWTFFHTFCLVYMQVINCERKIKHLFKKKKHIVKAGIIWGVRSVVLLLLCRVSIGGISGFSHSHQVRRWSVIM